MATSSTASSATPAASPPPPSSTSAGAAALHFSSSDPEGPSAAPPTEDEVAPPRAPTPPVTSMRAAIALTVDSVATGRYDFCNTSVSETFQDRIVCGQSSSEVKLDPDPVLFGKNSQIRGLLLYYCKCTLRNLLTSGGSL